MTYLPTLHAYLHQSSLLLQAYPHTTRITTKYSLPRKSKPPTEWTMKPPGSDTPANPPRQKREPSATLTLKTFHPESGICLKYRTDKAAEVGRLMTGLGRLAQGEIIELPTGNGDGEVPGSGIAIGGGEALSGAGPDVSGDGSTAMEGVQGQAKTAAQMTQQANSNAGGGGGKKKKKGKK